MSVSIAVIIANACFHRKMEAINNVPFEIRQWRFPKISIT